MKKVLSLVLILSLAVTVAYQDSALSGAWTTPKNHLWTEIGQKYAFANDRFNSDQDRIPLGWDYDFGVDKGGEWWAYDFEWKNEYGLADWLNALFSISYERAHYKEHSRPAGWGGYVRDSAGIKYFTIGGKARATETPIIVSYQILGYIPGINTKEIEPAIGKDDARLEMKVLLGKSYKFGRMPAYSGFETGYRFRGADEVADDIPLFFETGVVLTDWVMLQGELDTWIGIDGKHEDNESIATARLGLIYSPTGKFNQFRKETNNLNIAVQGGYTFWGINTNASWEVLLKISTTFDIPRLVNSLDRNNHENDRVVTHH